MKLIRSLRYAFPLLALPASLLAADWTMWGRTPARNMVSDETGMPDSFAPGKFKKNSEDVDLATTKNIKWVAKLGSQAYGNVTVAGGRVFVGTNNEVPRDPKYKGDLSMVMCLEEASGKFLWQQAVPKLGAGKVSDWEFLGICSSPLVDGDRLYVVTSRCEVVCLDVNGQANGNDGPFKGEATYVAGLNNKPIEQGATDGDIIWRYDMREELGVFPHNITSSSILMVGDRLYVTTSNGQDWSHVNIPAPRAPALICLDKKTGKLLGEETSGISTRLLHCNWSSPAYGEFGGKGTVVFGAGDGFCYGYDPVPVAEADGGTLKELWRFDCNPADQRLKPDGKPFKYPDPKGPNECIATPVVHKGRIYIAIGQDPEHGEGIGCLSCIDPAGKSGDITKSGVVWQYRKIGRSLSTVAIVNDLLFTADYGGKIYCLDANTGAELWVHDVQAHIWGSPLVADGKVYIGTEDGTFYVFAASKEKKLISQPEFIGQVYSTPITANGVLYIGTMTHLYAIQKTAEGAAK
jgi:outer membrane protein assembly factor BamB